MFRMYLQIITLSPKPPVIRRGMAAVWARARDHWDGSPERIPHCQAACGALTIQQTSEDVEVKLSVYRYNTPWVSGSTPFFWSGNYEIEKCQTDRENALKNTNIHVTWPGYRVFFKSSPIAPVVKLPNELLIVYRGGKWEKKNIFIFEVLKCRLSDRISSLLLFLNQFKQNGGAVAER